MPDVEGEKTAKRKFKSYPLGFFHIDLAEVRTEEGKLYLLVAIDRTTKFAFVELHEKPTTRISSEFLEHLIAACRTRSTPCLPTTTSTSPRPAPAAPLSR